MRIGRVFDLVNGEKVRAQFEREVIASTSDDVVTAGSGSQIAMDPKPATTEALDEKWLSTCTIPAVSWSDCGRI